MAASLLGINESATVNSSLTRQAPAAGSGLFANVAEARMRHVFRQGGTITRLWTYISANSLNTGTSTIFLRVNGANGNNTLSIGSGVTGEFEDTTNSDTISAGDLVGLQLVTSGASGSLTTRCSTITYTPSGTHNTKLFGFNNNLSTGASVTAYIAPVGRAVSSTTEANSQFLLRTAGTLRNLGVNAQVNSRSDSTTFRSRINGSNGNQTVSFAASTTGYAEDTSNTDAVASGDLIDISIATGGGTGTIGTYGVGFELDDSGSKFEMGCSTPAGQSLGAGQTRYFAVQGSLSSIDATEVNQQQNSSFAFTASRLRCYVSANAGVDAASLAFRINAASGSQSVSVTAATTGWFEDTSNTDSVAAGDLINFRAVGASSGAVTFTNISVTGAAGGSDVNYDVTTATAAWNAATVQFDTTFPVTTATAAWNAASVTFDVTFPIATATASWVAASVGFDTTFPVSTATANWVANAVVFQADTNFSVNSAVATWVANTVTFSGDTYAVASAVATWVANPVLFQAHAVCYVLESCSQGPFTYNAESGTPRDIACGTRLTSCNSSPFGHSIH